MIFFLFLTTQPEDVNDSESRRPSGLHCPQETINLQFIFRSLFVIEIV